MEEFIRWKKDLVARANEREFASGECSRTEPKEIDRAVHIKTETVENLEGPLVRSTKHLLMSIPTKDPVVERRKRLLASTENRVSDLLQMVEGVKGDIVVHPVLEERLGNLEAFLFRYEKEAEPFRPIPADIYGRLKRLETIVMALEHLYPGIL